MWALMEVKLKELFKISAILSPTPLAKTVHLLSSLFNIFSSLNSYHQVNVIPAPYRKGLYLCRFQVGDV
jgi:hypothetical protein